VLPSATAYLSHAGSGGQGRSRQRRSGRAPRVVDVVVACGTSSPRRLQTQSQRTAWNTATKQAIVLPQITNCQNVTDLNVNYTGWVTWVLKFSSWPLLINETNMCTSRHWTIRLLVYITYREHVESLCAEITLVEHSQHSIKCILIMIKTTQIENQNNTDFLRRCLSIIIN